MPNTYGEPAHALALEWMVECRDQFPAQDFAALVDMLASDIQDTLEDFTNPEYADLTMKHLRQRQARARGECPAHSVPLVNYECPACSDIIDKVERAQKP